MNTHPASISRCRRRAGHARGFTLLEMVIVLGIIAVILGGAIGVLGKVGDGAKLQRVEGDFNAIGSALRTYKINAGHYPSTQQGLRALVDRPGGTPQPRRWTSLMKVVPQDPWGQDYVYRFPGRKDPTEFELVSRGGDGQENTSDDISSQD